MKPAPDVYEDEELHR